MMLSLIVIWKMIKFYAINIYRVSQICTYLNVFEESSFFIIHFQSDVEHCEYCEDILKYHGYFIRFGVHMFKNG